MPTWSLYIIFGDKRPSLCFDLQEGTVLLRIRLDSMDTITQGLLGAVTAQLGFRRRIGRDATWVAAAAGVVPDLDILIIPLLSLTGSEVDGLTSAQVHRGLSHSLLLSPFIALPIAVAWWWLRKRRNHSPPAGWAGKLRAIDKPPSFGLLYACVFVAVLSHPLLDWCTSYGTQIFAPLTNTRYAIDAAPIIDIIYTPLLGLTLLACFLARKISRGRAKRTALVIGWAGFLLSVGYLAAGRFMHDLAIEKALKLVDKKNVVRADAYPALGSIFLWRTVIETRAGWRATRIHHFSNAPPSQWESKYAAKVPPNRWTERARRLDEYKAYEWFARGRVRREYQQTDGIHVVRFHDMRYSARGDGLESFWPLVVEFDAAGKLIFAGRRAHRPRREFRKHAAEAWRDLWNP